IECHSTLKKGLRVQEAGHLGLSHVPKPALVGFPRVKIFGGFSQNAPQLRISYDRMYGTCDRGCNVVLNGKDIGDITVVAIGPNLVPGNRIDDLGGDTNTL